MLSADIAEYKRKAEQYRYWAMKIPPTTPGPQGRAYYLAKSAEYARLVESAANLPTPPRATATPQGMKNVTVIDLYGGLQPTPPRATPQGITLKKQGRVHSKLAVEILSKKRADLHRAYSIWVSIDRSRQKQFSHAELLQFIAKKWGNDPRNVRRWLAAGNGIFWEIVKPRAKRIIYFYGKNRVFTGFNLSSPGAIQIIDTNLLTGQLKVLRANLFACFVKGESKAAARVTLQTITGIEPRTQRNYNAINGQRITKRFLFGMPNESGGVNKQRPNRYHRLHFGQTKIQDKKRYNLYVRKFGLSSPDDHPANVAKCIQRTEFRSPKSAIYHANLRGPGHVTYCVVDRLPNGTEVLKEFVSVA